MLKWLSSIFGKIPKQIRLFLGKALLLFLVWKFIYIFFLYESKYLDHKITEHLANSSISLINSLGDMEGFSTKRVSDIYVIDGKNISEDSSAIYHFDRMVLHIADACNGLELMVLYIGFIFCMPAKFSRKLIYIVLGIIILHLINILRCTGLIYLREYYQVYFQFAHRYLFNTIVYTATFIMWIVFSRKINLKNEVVLQNR